MKVYIKNEVLINRKPTVIEDYLSNDDTLKKSFKNEGGIYSVKLNELTEFKGLIENIIKVLDVPNIYPFVTPIENVLIVTFRQINRDTMCFK